MTIQLLSKSSGSSADIKLARIAQIYRELGEKNLPKGYWIVHVKVTNEEGYDEYKKLLLQVFINNSQPCKV